MGLDVQETDVAVDDFLTADEVFCAGTAVVICPIGRITTDDDSVELCTKMGPMTSNFRKMLKDIQLERSEDVFDWLRPLDLY